MNIQELAARSINGEDISSEEAVAILEDRSIPILDLLSAAYDVRKTFWGNDVTIHILNNAKNGHCPEDCSYCVQAKTSKADIADYPIKSEEEILAEAKHAYESGAHRYCMVFSGRGPTKTRVQKLAGIIKNIKDSYNIEVCLSPGLLNKEDTDVLKEAGLDRLNHNLNTSESFYEKICSTHTYEDRLNTLKAAQSSGIELCSGIIVGMGEKASDIVEVAMKLRRLGAESIPVNFYMPVVGSKLGFLNNLSPEYCLRVLSLFRFLNPKAEVRMAAGREMHLRSMQVMGLYPASSLFMDGYLNTKGTNHRETLQMIKDAGFNIKSDQDLEKLIKDSESMPLRSEASQSSEAILKTIDDLKPVLER